MRYSATTFPYRRALWLGGAVVALLQAWAFRHQLNPDAMSYLDLAGEVWRGHPGALVNGYWSPLYPFVLGIVLRIVRPAMGTEFAVVHFAGVGIFLFSFFCFEIFVARLIALGERDGEGSRGMPAWAIWALADSAFVFYTLLFITVGDVLADLLMTAFVYLAAAATCEICAGRGWPAYARLGIALGVAYLAKGVMFPVACVFLLSTLFVAGGLARRVTRTIVACAMFLLVASVLIVPLSRAEGHVTAGNTGAISYAEFVDGARRYVHWEGWPPETGRPLHPTRLAMQVPPVFEFEGPIGGTYPPWYDPAYWYAGIVPAFRLGNQLRAIRYTIEEYVSILPYMAALMCGLVAMACYARRDWRQRMLAASPVWLASAAALVLYGLVYVDGRFTVAFFCVIWMAAFASLRFVDDDAAGKAVRALTLAMVLTLGVGTAWLGGRAAFRGLAPKPFMDLQAAQALRALGIEPGQTVASIGFDMSGYWAHLAGVRIVAEIPSAGSEQFWGAREDVQREALAIFARAGATIAVSAQPSAAGVPGWRPLGTSGYYYNWLSPEGSPEGR